MKLFKWIIIGAGVLFLLWVFGFLFKILGIALGLIGGVFSVLSALLFTRAFWFLALVGFVLYLVFKNKKRSPVRGPRQYDAEDSYFKTVGDLDRRLDRLNEILSRDQ